MILIHQPMQPFDRAEFAENRRSLRLQWTCLQRPHRTPEVKDTFGATFIPATGAESSRVHLPDRGTGFQNSIGDRLNNLAILPVDILLIQKLDYVECLQVDDGMDTDSSKPLRGADPPSRARRGP